MQYHYELSNFLIRFNFLLLNSLKPWYFNLINIHKTNAYRNSKSVLRASMIDEQKNIIIVRWHSSIIPYAPYPRQLG